jgi:hypothetical protein
MIIEFWKTKENPITCYRSRKNREETIGKIPTTPKRLLSNKHRMQPVIVEHPTGEKQEYKSVTDAATALKIKDNTLCSILNGRGKQPTEYKVFKSIINQ